MQNERNEFIRQYLGLDSVYGVKLPELCVFALNKKYDLSRCAVFPGFCDVHVHLREPGFSYKETVATGTRAAAHGGYTDICAMPNLDPVPDSVEHLQPQLKAIERDACIGVHPYGAITVEEKGRQLADMAGLAPLTVAFSDDGKGVQDDALMRRTMRQAQELGKVIAAHCEDESLLQGGYIHAGEYARRHGHAGICSQSEWGPIARDLELVRETGCAYHVCHVSTKESVALIRRAKAQGLNVTCETAPHYLTLCEEDLREDGRFKMNPPLRMAEDRDALLEGLADGTIDMIATDHAPHSAAEKAQGLKGSKMGVVGLETAFPILYTRLVLPGRLSLERLLQAMAQQPRRRFGIPDGQDFSIWDLQTEYRIEPDTFLSMGKSTPFAGWKVYGRCLATIRGGKIIWQEN